jgi:hypothetical protein
MALPFTPELRVATIAAGLVLDLPIVKMFVLVELT